MRFKQPTLKNQGSLITRIRRSFETPRIRLPRNAEIISHYIPVGQILILPHDIPHWYSISPIYPTVSPCEPWWNPHGFPSKAPRKSPFWISVQPRFFSRWTHQVVPQFGIAQLVRLLVLFHVWVYAAYESIVFIGDLISQHNWGGGPHLAPGFSPCFMGKIHGVHPPWISPWKLTRQMSSR